MKPSGATDSVLYEKGKFSAPEARIERFSDVVLTHFQRTAGTRVLDIGCGSGEQVFSLGLRLSESELCGVDISPMNITAALEQKMPQSNQDDRNTYSFVLGDYLEFDAPTSFDLVISYSTLHLIPAATAVLLDKIANDLKPGGRLIVTIPGAGLYNRLLILVRRGFRAIRGPLTDRLILTLGRWLTVGRVDEVQLQERIIYMYMIPHFVDDAQFRALSMSKGLRTVASMPELHASIAQLKHNCVVMEKI